MVRSLLCMLLVSICVNATAESLYVISDPKDVNEWWADSTTFIKTDTEFVALLAMKFKKEKRFDTSLYYGVSLEDCNKGNGFLHIRRNIKGKWEASTAVNMGSHKSIADGIAAELCAFSKK